MSTTKFRRRTFLGGGVTAGLASMFLRPLEAAASNGPPTRFLILHRPCGTIASRFFPAAGGTTTSFTLGPIMSPFEALKNDMVIFNDVTASRDPSWQGDSHGQGFISSLTGNRAISDGEPINGDPQYHHITAATPSIDWLLLNGSPKLQGSPVGSIHLGAYRDSVQGGRIFPEGGAANFRPLSYKGANMPIFPEIRPAVAAQNLFGNMVAGGAAAVARQQQLNKSVLDLVAKDLGALQKQVPASQRPKLDAHLAAIQHLETQIAAVRTTCTPPTLEPALTTIPAGTPSGLRIDALEHTLVSKEQLDIIKVGFQCDLIRAATFTYAHGNSDVQFSQLIPTFGTMTGHHDISHATDAASVDRLAAIDQFYCARVAEFLTDLKNTPEGTGNMLDNTFVVFFSEVALGAGHGWTKMPVTFFGGKSVGLQGGRNLMMNGRYLNDIWASVLLAFGLTLPADNKFGGNNVWKGVTGPRLGEGAVPGIFA
ncbi:MAG: putative conserved secreted protein [Myxococcales bacterium]|nr:putative conserved secreted protein [Myxococcales bacterium]